MKHWSVLGVIGVGVCGGVVCAQPDVIEVFGFKQILIGDPGNRNTTGAETAWYGNPNGSEMGRVDYLFRLSKYELTVEQHLEFVEAYLPYYFEKTGNTLIFGFFGGSSIRLIGGVPAILPWDSPEIPSAMNWEYVARFVNWLHHGKVNEEWAFETGVYDISTFTQNADGSWNHQQAHDSRARFWIPTLDEWVKGAYWDPSLDAHDGGYWRYPTSSDTEPMPGLPEDGGERNAGDTSIFPISVASYPDIQSPWGLLDMAGGYWEYTETPTAPDRLHRRWQRGSWYVNDSVGSDLSLDILGMNWSVTLFNSNATLRLATGIYHPADLNLDGQVNFFDVSQFIRWFANGDERADMRGDGVFDLDDVRVFLGLLEL